MRNVIFRADEKGFCNTVLYQILGAKISDLKIVRVQVVCSRDFQPGRCHGIKETKAFYCRMFLKGR
jgi:hypothetical protein